MILRQSQATKATRCWPPKGEHDRILYTGVESSGRLAPGGGQDPGRYGDTEIGFSPRHKDRTFSVQLVFALLPLPSFQVRGSLHQTSSWHSTTQVPTDCPCGFDSQPFPVAARPCRFEHNPLCLSQCGHLMPANFYRIVFPFGAVHVPSVQHPLLPYKGLRNASVALGHSLLRYRVEAVFPSLLQQLLCCAQAFFLTLWVISAIALWRALLSALPGPRSTLYWCCFLSCASIPGQVLCAFRCASPRLADASMPLHRGLHRYRPGQVRTATGIRHRRAAFLGPLLRWWIWCIGFSCLPVQVWGVPNSVHEAVRDIEHLTEQARALSPERLDPDPAADFFLPSPYTNPRPVFHLPHGENHVSLPLPRRHVTGPTADPWLGVTVFRFGFQCQCFGLRCGQHPSLVGVTSQVSRQVQQRHDPTTRVVAIHPQRHAGYASFVAYSTVLDSLNLAAVMLDMTSIGGHYFPVVLPTQLSVGDLFESVRAYHHSAAEPWEIVVGLNLPNQHVGSQLHLAHGDVLTIQSPSGSLPWPHTVADLFCAGHAWGPLHHMPTPTLTPGVAVWFRGEFFALPSRRTGSLSPVDFLVQQYRLDRDRLLAITIREVTDLELHGEPCANILVLHEAQAPSVQGVTTCPFVTVCDPRLIGGLPFVCPEVVDISAEDLAAHMHQPFVCLRNLGLTCRTIGTDDRHYQCQFIFPPRQEETVDGAAQPMPTDTAIPTATHVGDSFPLRDRRRQEHGEHTDDSDSTDHADTASSSSANRQQFQAKFLVLRYEHAPEEHQVHLHEGIPVQTALDRVSLAFAAEDYELYPLVVEVCPQPSSEWGTVLALPNWAANEAIGVLDLREFDSRIFAAVLPPMLNRSRLCAAAAVEDDGSFDVWIQGHCLGPADLHEVPLRPFCCISFVPIASRHHSLPTLSNMLSTRFGWNVDAVLPLGPSLQHAESVYAVLDHGCRRYHIVPGRREHYLSDLAQAFDIPFHWISVQIAKPAVVNAAFRGYRCKGVAAVSEQIPNVPIPPRKPSPKQFIILVDARPLFFGWDSWVIEDDICSHAKLVDHYDAFAPREHQVQIDGAPLEGGLFQVLPGTVLTVQFVPCTPDSHAPGQGDSSSPQRSLADSATDVDPDGPSPHPTSGSAGRHNGRVLPARSPSRSRSPRISDAAANHLQHLILQTFGSPYQPAKATRVTDVSDCPSQVKCPTPVGVICPCETSWPVLYSGATWLHHVPPGTVQGLCQIFGWAKQARIPDVANTFSATALHGSPAGQPALPHLRDLGDRSPVRPQLPTFEVPIPELLVGNPPPEDMDVLVIVLAPEYRPEVFLFHFGCPAEVAQVLDVVRAARLEDHARRFPRLDVVCPQPSREYAILLATPAWLADTVPVLFDLRQFNGVVFSGLLASATTREALLSSAGLGSGANMQVYVPTQVEPLAHAQAVSLDAGACVLFLPPTAVASPRATLDIMLQSTECWDAEAQLPFHFGPALWLLNDHFPFRYDVDPSRPRVSRADIAEALECNLDGLVLVPVQQTVPDHFLRGWTSSAVLVATEALPLQPVEAPGPTVVVLDQRPVLLGFSWFTVPDGQVDLQQLVDDYANECPDDCAVAVSGAPTALVDQTTFLRVTQGHRLTIEYVPLPPLAIEPDVEEASTSPPGSAQAADDPGGFDSPSHAERDEVFGSTGLPSSVVPPQSPQAGSQHSSEDARLDLLSPVPCQVASAVITPDFCNERYLTWLQMPAPISSLVRFLDSARREEYPSRAHAFPRLVPVFPQPDANWALFMATPTWTCPGTYVCVDTRAIDGRLFAARAPPLIDIYAALFLANLPLTARVDIFVASSVIPLADGQEAPTFLGARILFLPPGQACSETLTLETMLETHLPWASAPAFPDDDVNDHYLVCSPEDQYLFELEPMRAISLRTDLALLVNIPLLHLVISPAVPLQRDVLFQGRPCRNVLAVSSSAGHHHPGNTYPVLVDCRRLLQGWLWAATNRGSLHLAELADSLACAMAPPARIVFDGFASRGLEPVHLPPGTVLVASLAPTEDAHVDSAPNSGISASSSPIACRLSLWHRQPLRVLPKQSVLQHQLPAHTGLCLPRPLRP